MKNNWKEIWKPIKDYEGLYEVSNFGVVRSIDRTVIVNRLGKKDLINTKLMTNDLKNFLDRYHDNEIFSDDQLGEIQYVIIPKILDLVEKEVSGKNGNVYHCQTVEDISTIINNLRV